MPENSIFCEFGFPNGILWEFSHLSFSRSSKKIEKIHYSENCVINLPGSESPLLNKSLLAILEPPQLFYQLINLSYKSPASESPFRPPLCRFSAIFSMYDVHFCHFFFAWCAFSFIFQLISIKTHNRMSSDQSKKCKISISTKIEIVEFLQISNGCSFWYFHELSFQEKANFEVLQSEI